MKTPMAATNEPHGDPRRRNLRPHRGRLRHEKVKPGPSRDGRIGQRLLQWIPSGIMVGPERGPVDLARQINPDLRASV
jgi:hypothetical protein